jgi:hypothetical protein
MSSGKMWAWANRPSAPSADGRRTALRRLSFELLEPRLAPSALPLVLPWTDLPDPCGESPAPTQIAELGAHQDLRSAVCQLAQAALARLDDVLEHGPIGGGPEVDGPLADRVRALWSHHREQLADKLAEVRTFVGQVIDLLCDESPSDPSAEVLTTAGTSQGVAVSGAGVLLPDELEDLGQRLSEHREDLEEHVHEAIVGAKDALFTRLQSLHEWFEEGPGGQTEDRCASAERWLERLHGWLEFGQADHDPTEALPDLTEA